MKYRYCTYCDEKVREDCFCKCQDIEITVFGQDSGKAPLMNYCDDCQRSILADATHICSFKPERVLSIDPKTGGAKGVKSERHDLIPVGPLKEVAERYGLGLKEGYEARNWEKGYAWSLSYAALQRHITAFWSGEDEDPGTGSSHLSAVIFHAMALMEFGKTHPELDDRVK